MTAATAKKRAPQGDAGPPPPAGVEEFESPRVHQAEKPEQQGADNPPGNEASTVGCGGQRGGAGLPPAPPVRSVPVSGSAMTEDISALAGALAAAQADMRAAAKDAANPHFKTKYADLAAVWEAWREAGPRHGLAVIQLVEADGSSVTVTSTLAHVSGQWMRGVLRLPVSKGDAQGVGSAITYGRRYALSALVGVAPNDDDGEAAVGREASHAPVKPAAKNGSNGKTAKSYPAAERVANAQQAPAEPDPLKTVKADVMAAICQLWGVQTEDGSGWNIPATMQAAGECLLLANHDQPGLVPETDGRADLRKIQTQVQFEALLDWLRSQSQSDDPSVPF